MTFVTVYPDNAAGRLHALLGAFRRQQDQAPLSSAWSGVLGEPAGSPEFLARLASLCRLPDEIKTEIGKVDSAEYDADLTMRWYDTVAGALGPMVFTGQSAGQVAGLFNNETLASLEHCSYVLHRHRPERVFAESELDRIATLITELKREVQADPEMDRDLRDFLLYHVAEMERALEELKLRGPAALEDAFDRAYGPIMRRADLSAKGETSPKAWRKFGDLLIAVAAVLQITTSTLALPGQIQELEGGPHPVQGEVVQPHPQQPAPSVSREANGARASSGKASEPKR